MREIDFAASNRNSERKLTHPKGASARKEYTFWSFNCNALSQGRVFALAQEAADCGVDVMLMQGTRWRQGDQGLSSLHF